MILQKISKAIREQNYYAVALEFVIVIAGVVIGFQLQDWAASHEARAEEEALLARLYDESLSAITYIDADIRSSVYSLRLLDRSVAALNSGSLGDLTLDEFTNGVWASARYRSLTPPSAVADEIIASGRIGLIEDASVREALSRYLRSREFFAQQLPYFRSLAAQPDQIGGAAFGSVYRPDLPERRATRPDFEALTADDRFVRDITGSIYGQIAMIKSRSTVREEAFALCLAVAATLERECEADRLTVELFPSVEEPMP